MVHKNFPTVQNDFSELSEFGQHGLHARSRAMDHDGPVAISCAML